MEEHRRRRDEALQTIHDYKGATRAMDPENVRMARAYLDNWRQAFLDDVNDALPEFFDRHPPKPYTPPATPYRPDSPGSIRATPFRSLVDSWHAAHQSRLSAMSTSKLQARYLASRVLRHAPEILALAPYLDMADVAFAQIQAIHALNLLRDDLQQPDTADHITALLDLPRLPDAIISPTVWAEAQETINTSTAEQPDQIAPQIEPTDPLDWIRANANQIDHALRSYLEDNRWGVLGSHMGAIIQQINDDFLPTLLNDPDAVHSELTPETAAFISLLKAGLVPDHTDDEDAVTAWFEDLVLWIEDRDRQEIPPQTIRDYAEIHGVPLLPLGPNPGTITA